MKKQNSTHKKEWSDQSGRKTGNQHLLVLFNDEVHDFSYVIESLVEVCNHDNVQAEQCTYLAHYKGRCEVKQGSYEDLKQMKQALVERELQTEIH